MPRREGGRRFSKDRTRARQNVVQPGSQTGSMKAHQQVFWSLNFIVFGVHLVKAEVLEDQAICELHPDRHVGLPGMKKEMMIWETWCRKPKAERGIRVQGKDETII